VIRLVLIAIALGCAGCFSSLDTDDLPPIDDYDSWYRVDATGDIPDHDDTYRIIYVNDIARSYGGVGDYPIGSVIIKEIHLLDGDGPGKIDYIAAMRKLAEDDADLDDVETGGADLQEGWVYTFFDSLGDDEKISDRCYSLCHVAAPFDGAFLDYSE
jgi:hypothetical protein